LPPVVLADRSSDIVRAISSNFSGWALSSRYAASASVFALVQAGFSAGSWLAVVVSSFGANRM
jgi:hypothetical protein